MMQKTINKYKGITKTNATVSTTTIPVWSNLGKVAMKPKTSYKSQEREKQIKKRATVRYERRN